MKTRELLTHFAAGQLTLDEVETLVTAQRQLHVPPRTPMSLYELRLLLKGMEGKIVRGALVASASVAVEFNTLQFSVIVSHAVPPRLQGETTKEAMYRVLTGAFYSGCVCRTEDELRAVLTDPTKADWYMDDEE